MPHANGDGHPEIACPLCGRPDPTFYYRDRRRTYWQCGECALVFVPLAEHVDTSTEKARYDTHRNDPDDCAYRRFLSRLAEPLIARVPRGAEGLDFGCGPGPALATMLRAHGLRVALYDPFYWPDDSVWLRAYDFITATEVLEHLRRPAHELDRLFGVLRPGGWLGVMTRPIKEPSALENWHYIRDPTHVCFYGRDTFAYIGNRWQADVERLEEDVVLLRRRGGDASLSVIHASRGTDG